TQILQHTLALTQLLTGRPDRSHRQICRARFRRQLRCHGSLSGSAMFTRTRNPAKHGHSDNKQQHSYAQHDCFPH
ncbi:MAG: hypothetical protein ACK6EB_17555, partial [Planctomyces sp.]